MMPVVNLIFSKINVMLNMLFPLLVYPYLARILGPENLGLNGYYGSVVSYGILISSFGVGIYGVKKIGEFRHDDGKRKVVISQLLFINLIFASFTYVVILIIEFIFKNNNILIPIIMGFTIVSGAISCEWYFIATENQKYIVIRNLIAKTITLFLIFIFIKTKKDLMKYIFINSLMNIVQHLYNYWSLRKKERTLKLVIDDTIKIHLYSMFKTFLVEMLFRYFGLVDIIILGIVSSTLNVGYYGLALNVYNSIVSVMKISATALLPRMAYYIVKTDETSIKELMNKTSDMLLFVGVPASIFCYMWAEPIVNLLGGKQFVSSIDALKYLSFLIIPAVILNMLVFQYFYPNGKIRLLIFSFSGSIFLNVIINIVFIPLIGFQSITISSLISTIIVLTVLFFSDPKIIQYVVTKNTIKYILIGIFALIIEIIVKNYIFLTYLPVHFIIGLAVDLGALILMREDTITPAVKKMISNFFRRTL